MEEGGQHQAGDWTSEDRARLDSLVTHAHQLGYWIRFYTLDGFSPSESQGWNKGYNFGSHPVTVEKRWQAACGIGRRHDSHRPMYCKLLAQFMERLKRN